jgi:hypothetical protein
LHCSAMPWKANGRHSEEVHRPGDLQVISQEGQAGWGLVSSSPLLDQVLPDGVWAGWIETEQHPMSRDGFRTPQDILTTQSSDPRSHFWADRRSSSLAPRFPAPPLQKGILMPLENRPWFHQIGGLLPSCLPEKPHIHLFKTTYVCCLNIIRAGLGRSLILM